MILSKSCIYGIQALIAVAAEGGTEYVPIHKLAERLDISFHFLTKVLQEFTHAGILNSYRGPRGGVALAKPAATITMYDMVATIDGTEIFTECMLGLPGCGIAPPCPAHEQWQVLRNQLSALAKSLTLDDLARRANELNVRLSRTNDLRQIMHPFV
ncbi:MAG: Rrf2 family transcriptional regulator [Bradyrhizobiaceae bacterium]|nr:Rrf2 family transcriptional regulator [Bradyrhizobiaceae bacterium]